MNMTKKERSSKKYKKRQHKHLLNAETKLTLIYIGIAVVLIGGVVAIMLYGPPDERLQRAIPACDSKMARTAIEKGANVNVRSEGDDLVIGAPALFSATRKGCVEIVELLLSHEADVNATVSGKLYNGWTALMTAADRGDVPLVRLLLKYDADAALTIPDGDKQGWTALKLAESKGYTEIIKLLKEAGAK